MREVEIETQMINKHIRKCSTIINNFLKKQEVMNILKNLIKGGPFLKVWNTVLTQIKKFATEFTLEGSLAMSWPKYFTQWIFLNEQINE